MTGPSCHDPRRNKLVETEHINKYLKYILIYRKEGDVFWNKYFGCRNCIRWDLFEEILLNYLEDHIFFQQHIPRQMDWNQFFSILLVYTIYIYIYI